MKASQRSGEKRALQASGCSRSAPTGIKRLSTPRFRIFLSGSRTSALMSSVMS
ncbi:hypothetical protein SCE1572_13210 [Sorangium cellulosum So0157-2]|uniref:Uncharacterized protein n=1 Tax=Sorangium cellulosum So0157-2 TaxID=1254432 RepID=S4XXQ1_SORCE|nr:hypothetical protein SCE1572_13210 [Sorangium cellulosum So0157-2]